MAIIIKIGPGANDAKVRLEMDVRKSMNGDLMIFDHGDIDIVLSTAKNKIIAFPKDTMNDWFMAHKIDYLPIFAKKD